MTGGAGPPPQIERALARNRSESRFMTYECVLNDRTNRVLSASYDLRGPARYGALQ